MLLLVLTACYDALVLQVVLDVTWPLIVFKLLALCTSSDVLQVLCPFWWQCWNFHTLGRKELQLQYLCWLSRNATKTWLFQQV